MQPVGGEQRLGTERDQDEDRGGHAPAPQSRSPAVQPWLTVHASELCLAQHGGDPELLGIHVCSHQGVTRWHLDHGFQLTAHPVSLQDMMAR